MPDWKDEVAHIDIADVAQRLGMQVAPGRRSPRLAVCPFHDDTQPSLHLYQDDDPHYHCFACHAHGDTVELVKQRRSVDFLGALAWLGATYGFDPGSRAPRSAATGQDIRQRAVAFLRERDDGRLLRAFADARGFTLDVLKAAGLTAGTMESFLQTLARDGAAQDEAVEAGLAYAPDTNLSTELRSRSLSPFVRGDAIFIPLANLRGKPGGLLARPLAGGGPKYRFTTGTQKSQILYRADHVRRQIEAAAGAAPLDGATDRFDLFLVEGVLDALRLESLGLPAAAILGSAISDAQAGQVAEIAELALEKGRVLRVHLFLDADRGGREGLADALPRMLRYATDSQFLVDGVALDRPEEEKADPDVLLKGFTPEAAVDFVRGHLVPVLDALAAISLGLSFAQITETIAALDAAGSIILQNRLARRLQKLDWPRVWRNLSPDQTTLGDLGVASAALSRAYARLAQDLEGRGRADVSRSLPEPFGADSRTPNADLLHAMVLARESADSREYPVDVAAWDRIEAGATAFLPVLAAQLVAARGPTRPYLAHREAKDSGAPRLKCGPCPEDAIQQQYVLSELLRVRPTNREFAEQMPAVRYWSDQPNLVVTGETRPETAVSFAYQIDMRALEERPDRNRRRDMFRPFLDCWNSFIRHIGARVERMRCDLIYVARLDIKAFYDHVPRYAVARVLDRALLDAETLRTLDFAPLLGDLNGDRRETLHRWLLDHSFGADDRGYRYVDPGSGEPTYNPGGGIKGLPQGPVLSSYLANIVLFDLDAALEARVRTLDAEATEEDGKRTCGGVYARYVDDIVIAARSPDDLRALRGAIEIRLEALGLELNEKSEHLAPMTAEEARDWVVERRGAGFVAYGQVDDQPSPAADVRTSWADIPALDRRTALSVLHWSALDDPEQTPRDGFEALIVKVAQAESLRPTDLGQIARRVLLRAMLDGLQGLPAGDTELYVAQFLRHTVQLLAPLRATGFVATGRLRAEDVSAARALAAAREFIAVLTGLERLIASMPENNPTFSAQVRGDISRAKTTLLEWILNHALLARLQYVLIAEAERTAVDKYLGAQLEIQRASLEERAARALRLGRAPLGFRIAARPKAEAPKRLGARIIRIGWLRTFAPDGLADLTSPDPAQVQHTIAAGAQVEGGRLGAAPEFLPIASFSAAITSLAEQQFEKLPEMAGGAAADIAMTFRALAGAPVTDQVASENALPAFLALSEGPGQSEALARRPGLLLSAIPNATILPVPPVPGQPGVFCYEVLGARRQVHAIFVKNLDDPLGELPHDLQWREAVPISGLRRWTADLPPQIGFLLDPRNHSRHIEDDLGTIANVFESLVQRHHLGGSPRVPLVHVFSLIGPVGRGAVEAGYFSLSWRVDALEGERLIFERRGDGLAVQRSPHAGAELWRIGQSVSDLFAIPHEAEEEAEDAGVKRDRHLLQARLKRAAFARLRGRWIHAAQVTAALARGTLPRALERIFKALREVSGDHDHVGPLALEFLLSGRAMRSRMRLGGAVEVPGGWARFLEMVGARGLRSGDDDELFTHAATRLDLARPSRALARAGDTIDGWAIQAEAGRSREALCAMALGFELAALRLDVRDLALAILARLSPQGRERLGRVRPGLNGFEGLGPMLLVEPRFGHGETAGRARGDAKEPPWGYEAEWQGRELFVTIHEALGLRALQGRAQLERISTAGWLTVLSVMAGAFDFEMEAVAGRSGMPLRPAFFPLADLTVAAPLKALVIQLLELAPAPTSADADAWPWELTSTLDTTALRRGITAARRSLNTVREAAGVVATLDPPPLRSLAVGEQGADFYTGDGHHYDLPWWRCTLTATVTERIDRTETTADGDRRFHPCSLLADENGVLVVQVVSESLSKVTGMQAVTKGAPTPGDGTATDLAAEVQLSDEPASGPLRTKPTAQKNQGQNPANRAASAAIPPSPAVPTKTPATPLPTDAPWRAIAPADPSMPAMPKVSGQAPLGKWREYQDRFWRRRAEGSGLASSGYGRVAILQYDFLESYKAEKLPEYVVDGNTLDPDLRVAWGAVDLKLSFEEHRRRQVLATVLSCCQSLGVETLVLPEYSAHPETVSWLEQHCRQREYKVSIWAGTFRQQPGFALGLADGHYYPVALDVPEVKVNPMETHLSVLFRETQDKAPIGFSTTGDIADEAPLFRQTLAQGVRYRQKKYPSIGMGEEFKPSTAPLEPLMAQSRSVQRIESYVSELVCSELFVFNGPLNWHSFAEHLAASSVRYKVDGKVNVGEWLDHIIGDAKSAALSFSGADGHKPRRSLLFVTCATTRDADYHYFAQSAYLASGIVTAFCNGSGQGVTGGSCFVGQGVWETRGDGPPIPNPYHGATPGILSNGLQRGALGRRENALIVADVRPDRTVEDKPRSQALGAPMRLVAHIPIVEEQSSSAVEGRWNSTWYRPRLGTWVDPAKAGGNLLVPEQHPQLLHNAASNAPIDLSMFVGHVLEVLRETETAGSTLSLDAEGRNRVIAVTVSLSGLFASSPGMGWRAAALAKDHQALPERLPCPCLLDWLIVDLDLPGFEQHLCALRDLANPATKDEKRKKVIDYSNLAPALREAPWRWVARKREADETE